MSGLFRFNSNGTPIRPNSLSPFCTAPAQDVTMDNSFLYGYRSPTSFSTTGNGTNGNTNGGAMPLSPSQGRSLREYDEKLRALQKENFNLKLRLFFLDEKPPGTTASNAVNNGGTNGSSKSIGDDETLFKQNIDLKVENEELRKELQEKQGLLCQAAKAMELMEDSQRKSQETNSITVADLTQKVQYLEDELRAIETSTKMLGSNKVADPESNEQNLVDIDHSENVLLSKVAALEKTITENAIEIMRLSSEVSNSQTQLIDRELVIQRQQNLVKELNSQITKLNADENNILCASNDIGELQSENLKQKQEMADKLCLIQDLEEKLANKGKAHDKACKTIQLLLIKTRELDGEIEQLKSKDTKSSPNQSVDVNALRSDLIRAQSDAEKANRWRNECAEVCSVLMSRLKELAGFLDSLLKHKDVLSVLAQDRHKAMRKAIDNSLDLSRSINNISMSGEGCFSLNDRSSIFQITSISDLLNDDSYFAGREHIDESDLKYSSIVENLRTEVQMLRDELNKARIESKSNANNSNIVDFIRVDRSARNLSHHLDLCSESEEWSEPDRKVSHERIGLEDSNKLNAHVISPCISKYKGTVAASSSSSLSSCASHDDLSGSRLSRKNSTLRMQEKILDLETQLTEKNVQMIDFQNSVFTSKSQIAEFEACIGALNADVERYREESRKLQGIIETMKKQALENEQDAAKQYRLNGEQKKIIEMLSQELEKNQTKTVALEKDHKHRMSVLLSQEKEKFEQMHHQLSEQYSKNLDEQMTQQRDQMRRDFVPRTELNEHIRLCKELEKQSFEKEALLQMMRDNENQLKNKFNVELTDKENALQKLNQNIIGITAQTSNAVKERNKFMDERNQYERKCSEFQEKYDSLATECSELHSRLAKLSHENAQLHNKLVINETQLPLTRSASQGNARYALPSPKSNSAFAAYSSNSSGGDQSGYTSDELRQRLENSSPDLGIDSDGTGRSSGTDAITRTPVPNINRSKSELNNSFANVLLEGEEELDHLTTPTSNELTPFKSPSKVNVMAQHDCEKIEKENAELRRKFERTRRAFEKTWAQLRISNQRKEQIEKDIRQEIYKTHSVLKNARSNIESVSPLSKSASSTNV